MARSEEFAGLQLPSFVASVSSVKDDQPLEAYLALFDRLGVPCGLTSAYDWHHLRREAREAALTHYFDWTTSGGRMVLDSGWYEASWHRDPDWAHDAYVACALELMPSCAMSFDVPEPGSCQDAASVALQSWDRDQAALGGVPVVPIVHGDPGSLPAAVKEVAATASPGIIAIAERELGLGVIARARVVRAIRDALDDAEIGCGLHLLGTGSPISVLIYLLTGADSFDGLEWNRTAIDFETARLYHSQHFDFFEHQSLAAGSGSYWGRMLTHNLIFWQGWMERIRRGEGREMVRGYVPETGCALLAAAFPEIFS